MSEPESPNRRLLVKSIAGLASLPFVSTVRAADGDQGPLRPDPKSFAIGDIVWPKKPRAFVPYESETGSDLDAARTRWTRERTQFIVAARTADPARSKEESEYLQAIASRLEKMTFEEFYHGYTANVKPDDFVQQGGGQFLYVGHVAVVDVDASGVPWLVEAVTGPAAGCSDCVQRIRYDEWLANRGQINVWHARLRGLDAPARASVAAAARNFLGKPYNFWRFNLSDESGFYCSKLLWLSVMKATGIALDDNPNPKRTIWYSPLQVMGSVHIDRLYWPGNYQNV